MVMLWVTDNLILLYRTNTFKNISQNQKIGQNRYIKKNHHTL